MPGTEIRYTALPVKRYPDGSTPAEVTKHSMDATYQLEQYLDQFRKLYGDVVSGSAMSESDKSDAEALAELQFSFVCFLVGQHYDSFERWKQILRIFCQSDE